MKHAEKVPSFFPQKDQQGDEDDGAEREKVRNRDEGHPDPKSLFRIGRLPEEVRKTCDVSLGDSVADDENKEEREHAQEHEIGKHDLFPLYVHGLSDLQLARTNMASTASDNRPEPAPDGLRYIPSYET